MDWWIKSAGVFFTVVGVAYFLPSSIAFSLWAFYILQQIYAMVMGTATGDPSLYGATDQHFGAILAFGLAILWSGRRHWKLILAQGFRGARDDEPQGRYLSYRAAFWTFTICTLVMCLWLIAAGCTVLAAVVTVGLLLLLFLVITRVIAEAGLVHGMLIGHLWKPWELLAYYGVRLIPLKSFYLTGLTNASLFDFREVMPVFASHGVKLADQTVLDPHSSDREARSTGRKFIGLLALALLVGYAVSFASTLWTEYHYASTKDIVSITPINEWGTTISPRRWLLDPAVRYQTGTYHPPHSPATHIGVGFVITGAARAAAMALRLVAAASDWLPDAGHVPLRRPVVQHLPGLAGQAGDPAVGRLQTLFRRQAVFPGPDRRGIRRRRLLAVDGNPSEPARAAVPADQHHAGVGNAKCEGPRFPFHTLHLLLHVPPLLRYHPAPYVPN